MITPALLRDHLAETWGLSGTTVEHHPGGMNSHTWLVRRGPDRWVAKAVPLPEKGPFASGLAVASRVQEAGIAAGAPVRALDGRDVVELDDRALALLTWVEGEELSGDGAGDHELIGATLARAHRCLAGASVPGADRFHWVDPRAAHLGLRSWIRPAVTDAVAALDVLGSGTWGLLHTDPAPEAFRRDPAGGCGLIDWGAGMVGPLLYDLASAVMYVGGPGRADRLVGAYLRGGVLGAAEVERGLVTMLRFRWAVQADYFARRVLAGDLTGIDGPDGNERGLEHARLWLDRLRA
ncbi:phosphotransferase [Longispora sp. K20-0274]|uniref:phosphotransferase enzyme family protein n=1 Tax=Longispora sp. K20-0274 TaxID=3088255 RepID=UPI00399B0115